MHARLAPGVKPERAIAEIKELAGSKAAAVRPVSRHPVDVRDDYARWSSTTQARLETILRRDDVQALFNGARHLAILSMPPGNQLIPLVYADLDAVTHDLGEAVAYL